MHPSPRVHDAARHWRRFCRAGWHMAWGGTVLWGLAMVLLFPVAPPPEPEGRERPRPVSWWPGEFFSAAAGGAADLRALWSPAAFALPTPAGFSHSLRTERSRLTPPVEMPLPQPAFLGPPAPVRSAGTGTGRSLRAPALPLAVPPDGPRVFPARPMQPERPRMEFPDGWESRLFSGIDLNFGTWTNAAWTAEVEMHFDGKGVPVSMLLAKSSGRPDLDRRLARSVNGWRLLDPSAPRTGVVTWRNSAPPPAAGGEGVP